MKVVVDELEKVSPDEFIEMKEHLKEMRYCRAEDRRRVQIVEDEMQRMRDDIKKSVAGMMEVKMKELEDTYANRARMQETRMDVFATQLSAICDTLSNDSGMVTSGVGQAGDIEGDRAVEDFKAYQRLDAVIKQLATQVERAGSFQVHETKVACHCTHTVINQSIKKLSKRTSQVRGITCTWNCGIITHTAMSPG